MAAAARFNPATGSAPAAPGPQYHGPLGVGAEVRRAATFALVGLIKTSTDIYFADVRLPSVRRDSSSVSWTPSFASSTILFMTRSKSPGFVAPIIFHTFLKAVLMFAAS
jgi:hypothetical protein